MIEIYFDLRDHAQRAQSALEDLGLDAFDPKMVTPYQSRSWMVEVEDADLNGPQRPGILQIVNRYDGVIRSAPQSQRPGGAPFVDGLSKSVTDRYESSREKP